jgi:hypothetical protein
MSVSIEASGSPLRSRSTEEFVFRAACAGALASIALTLGLVMHVVQVGSLADGWYYPYVGRFHPSVLLSYLAALALALGMLWLSSALFRYSEIATVAAWLGIGLCIQLVLRWDAPTSLGEIVRSFRANEFYGATLRVRAMDVLASFPAVRETLHSHAHSNMPGKLMLFYLLELITMSPRVLGVLIMALSNAGGWLLYLAVREWTADRRAALFSLILYLFVPGKIFFFPILNTVSPVPVLLCFWLHARYVNSQHWVWALALGVGLYPLVFYEPLPLVMGLLFAAMLGAALVRRAVSLRSLALLVCLTTVGFAVTYELVRLAVGHDLFESLTFVLEDASRFNDKAGRPYGVWVWRNLLEFALAAGVGVVTIVPAAVAEALRGPDPWSERLVRPVVTWMLGTFAALVCLDLAGVNRGEVVRLWIFAACFLQVVPAFLCARAQSDVPFALLIGGTLLEAAVGISLVGYVLP